ncbi:MAG: hypothetical protein ABI647_00850, partial [Gemmatimonadota bacterium]
MIGTTRLLVAATLCLTSSLAAQARRFELNDLGREITLSGPRLSPDGRQVAVVVTRTNYADNRFERSLVLVDVASGAVRDLTPGRRNIGSVEWAPSGDRLAFIDKDGEKPPQLFLLPLAGGEARRITDTKRGVSGFAWRPDGRSFAFLTEDEPVERTGEERHNKSFEVGDNMYLDQAASLATQMWTVAADGGEPTRVTSGVRSVTGVTWAPDGRRVLLSVRPRPQSGELINATVVLRDMETGAERTITERRGFGSLGAVSPDGQLVATIASRGAELGFRPGTVLVAPIGGGPAREVTEAIDRNLSSLRWLPDSKSLMVTAADLTQYRAWI